MAIARWYFEYESGSDLGHNWAGNEEQARDYAQALASARGLPVVFATTDGGDRKIVSAQPIRKREP